MDREHKFVIDFMKENDRTPTYSDCMEITRGRMIDKACAFLQDHLNDDGYLCVDDGTAWVDIKWLLRDLKNAMMEDEV